MAVSSFFRQFLLLLFVFLLPLAFSASDSEALLQFKKSLTNANALDSWVPGSAPCNGSRGPWKGLLCHEGVVKGLRLEGMGLSGSIDVDALVEIQSLRFLSVVNNSFTEIFPGINRLGALKGLYLSMNQFSGEIPSEYFAKMGSLKKLELSDNKFTGNIPVSLARLSHLIELHLENNHFSGLIPAFDSPTLNSFNVSNNRLEGAIPPSLSKFNASSFAGNPGLCGQKIGVVCRMAIELKDNTSQKVVATSVTLGILLFLVILSLAVRWKTRKEKNSNMIRKGRSKDTVFEVPVSLLVRKEASIKGPCSSRNDPSLGKVSSLVSELVMVNDEKGVFGLTDLMKASAEVLGYGALGSSYKVIMDNGVGVVVKRMRHMNALRDDAFDYEVKRLGNLRHPNVLTPLAYHYRREEKLLVSEYVSKGSLLYNLHGEGGKASGELDWPTRLKIVRGIAEGLEYLHTELASHDVPHGNLKSSNVLLDHDNHPFISDFGLHSLLNTYGLETLFAYKTPEAILQKTVSPKSDVYCLGIIILEILTGELPLQYPNNGNEGIDIVQWVASAFSEGRQVELLDKEMVEGCRDSVGGMVKLLRLGAICTEISPDQRLDIEEIIIMIKEIHVEAGVE